MVCWSKGSFHDWGHGGTLCSKSEGWKSHKKLLWGGLDGKSHARLLNPIRMVKTCDRTCSNLGLGGSNHFLGGKYCHEPSGSLQPQWRGSVKGWGSDDGLARPESMVIAGPCERAPIGQGSSTYPWMRKMLCIHPSIPLSEGPAWPRAAGSPLPRMPKKSINRLWFCWDQDNWARDNGNDGIR